jgi:hypothetical protein
MRLVLIPALVLIALSLPAVAGESTYGAALTLDGATAITDILDRPGDFAGKLVQVEGKVTAMCEHKGCWLRLEASDGRLLLAKSTGDKVVVPGGSVGRKATVEGTVIVDKAPKHEHEHKESEGHDCPTASVRLETAGVVLH